MDGLKRFLLVLAVAACGAGGAGAQRFERGSEFLVNSYTNSSQGSPSVGMIASGGFIVVWNSDGQDGSASGVFGQRFRSDGTPRGAEFQINTHTPNHQDSPSVGMNAAGDIVVAWESRDQAQPDYGIVARTFDAAGVPLSAEFLVNAYTAGHQTFPSIATNAAGDFVVAWRSYLQDGSDYGVFARRFDSSGAAAGPEFQANIHTTSFQVSPAVGMGPAGDFVIVWYGEGPGSASSAFARRFDSFGTPIGAEFPVSAYTSFFPSSPSIAMDAGGGFVVTWDGNGQDGSANGVFGRRFDASGTPLGDEFQVNTYTTNHQGFSSVAMDAAGNFVVIWQSLEQDGSSWGTFGRRFDVSGTPLGDEFQVNTYTTGTQSSPSVGMDAAGNFVVAWDSAAQDGSEFGVFAQRFAGPPLITIPLTGDAADCGAPPMTPPAIEWKAVQYEKFRVYLSWDPAFDARRRVSSGDAFLTAPAWTPPRRKWRRACAEARAANPSSPEIYVQVLGVDVDVPKNHPARRNRGNVVTLSVEP